MHSEKNSTDTRMHETNILPPDFYRCDDTIFRTDDRCFIGFMWCILYFIGCNQTETYYELRSCWLECMYLLKRTNQTGLFMAIKVISTYSGFNHKTVFQKKYSLSEESIFKHMCTTKNIFSEKCSTIWHSNETIAEEIRFFLPFAHVFLYILSFTQENSTE